MNIVDNPALLLFRQMDCSMEEKLNKEEIQLFKAILEKAIQDAVEGTLVVSTMLIVGILLGMFQSIIWMAMLKTIIACALIDMMISVFIQVKKYEIEEEYSEKRKTIIESSVIVFLMICFGLVCVSVYLF